MRLSVIMACYNAAATVGVQLEALAGQRCDEPWEIVIADNGSTDGTLDLVERYRSRLPALRVVHATGSKSCARARNVGMEHASGDAFVFCDADDAVAPGWLAAIARGLAAHEFVVAQIETERLNPVWLRHLFDPPKEGPRPHLGFLPVAPGWSISFRRSVYLEVGPFDESLPRLEDIDYSWRVQLAGKTLHFVPEAVVHYRYRDTFRGMYRQARLDGKCQVLLYRRYASHGMPWRTPREALWYWRKLVRRIPEVGTREGRATWVTEAGFLVGRLQGSVAYRTLAL